MGAGSGERGAGSGERGAEELWAAEIYPPHWSGTPPRRGFLLINLELKYREERMPLQASTQEIHSQGSLRGGDPPPQRGVWGSVPPDPGSAPTRKIRRPQIRIVYRLAITSKDTLN
jgi:hypothetical protein